MSRSLRARSFAAGLTHFTRAVLLTLAGSALLAAPAAASAAHPDSLSSSTIEIGADRLLVTIRFQTLSLLEVLPLVDADGDGTLDDSELAAQQDAVFDYLREHYRIGTDSNRGLEAGRWLELEGLVLRSLPADEVAGAGPGYAAGGVEALLEHTFEDPVRDLLVEATLFHETSPDHIDLCALQWPDGGLRHMSLTRNAPRDRSDPEGRGTVLAFLRLGLAHVLGGWDHLAFVTLLFLGARGFRSLLAIVTAFTLAHSITLVAAALDLIDLGRHAPLVEAGIALSIAWVAVELVREPSAERGRWPEALALGLIHGLGFAGFLADSLVREEAKLRALVGFNLGIEVGQVAFVSALALVTLPFGRDAEGRPGSPNLRRAAGVLLGAWALYLFLGRI